jgi:hypothetical protein
MFFSEKLLDNIPMYDMIVLTYISTGWYIGIIK